MQAQTKCSVLITITEEEIKLCVANKEHKIKYTISSSLKGHICNKKDDKKTGENEIKSKEVVYKNNL